jgi:hypothetical protein
MMIRADGGPNIGVGYYKAMLLGPSASSAEGVFQASMR